MAITQAEIKTTAKLLVGVGALAGAPGVGTANTVIGIGTSLMDLYAGRRTEAGWETKVTEALEAKLADPEFHRPASADRLLPQLIEFGLPSPEDLTGEGWDANRIARLMRNRVPERSSDPAHADAVLLDAFELWVISGLAPLLDDPAFVSGQAGPITREMFDRFAALETGQATTHDKLDEILRLVALGKDPSETADALTLEELREVAAGFGDKPGSSKADLITFLNQKASDFAKLREELEALRDLSPQIDNVVAQAEAALERRDLQEAYDLLEGARDNVRERLREPLELNARLSERQADIEFLRGRVREAYRLLRAAADSFASIDPYEPARRMIRSYYLKMRESGLRYGGDGLALSAEMVRPFLNDSLKAAELELWGDGQNNLAIVLQELATSSGGAEGAELLSEAVTAYRAALQVGTEVDYPVAWAAIQNNLGNALSLQGTRTGGERGAALVTQAEAAYRSALRVRTEEDLPMAWAMTQNNLGTALRQKSRRIAGEAGATLLTEAMTATRAALRVYTEVANPVDWAVTQDNLGNVLYERACRMDGETGAALLADAEAAFRAALRVRTEADHPVDWAETQNNLGLVWQAKARFASGQASLAHFEEAVAAYRAALRVRTAADQPLGWAETIANIAMAEEAIAENEACAEPEAHLKAAVDAMSDALKIFDPEFLPHNFSVATELKARLEAKLAGLEGGSD